MSEVDTIDVLLGLHDSPAPRRRRVGIRPALLKIRRDFDTLVSDIQALETKAHKLGMVITARGLNHAKNAAGWEMAGNVLRAGAALAGAREPERKRRRRK